MCRIRQLVGGFRYGSGLPTVFFEAISVGEFHEQGRRYACTTGRGTSLAQLPRLFGQFQGKPAELIDFDGAVSAH